MLAASIGTILFSREVTGGLASSIRPRHSRQWCSKVAMHAEEYNPVKDMVLFQTPIGWVAISEYAVLPGPGSAVLQRQAGTPLAAYTCTTTRPAKKQTKHPDVPCGFFSGPWPQCRVLCTLDPRGPCACAWHEASIPPCVSRPSSPRLERTNGRSPGCVGQLALKHPAHD